MRHGDRQPKQKIKFFLKSSKFLDLMNVKKKEEITIKDLNTFDQIENLARNAKQNETENSNQMDLLINILSKKKLAAGTKIQIKAIPNLEKIKSITLNIKWGGCLTHAGRNHSFEFGDGLKKDLKIVCPKIFECGDSNNLYALKFSTGSHLVPFF